MSTELLNAATRSTNPNQRRETLDSKEQLNTAIYTCKAKASNAEFGREGQWVTGFFKCYITPKICVFDERYGWDYVHIVPDTVCRCTGLKDVNGDLIYEGDKVQWVDDSTVWVDSPRVRAVVWQYNRWALMRVDHKKANAYTNLIDTDELEIVGNIHDTEQRRDQ